MSSKYHTDPNINETGKRTDQSTCCKIIKRVLGPLLLTWFNLNPIMDKQSHAQKMGGGGGGGGGGLK